MICPNCGKEKGSEKQCPFCKAASSTEHEQNHKFPEGEKKRDSNNFKRMARQLAVLELRTKLIMLLMCGYFVLQLLMLLLFAIK